MAVIKFVIDTSTGNLLVSELNQATLEPSTIKLNAGDTPLIQINLMAKVATAGTGFPYAAIPTAGITPTLYITDGTISGTTYVSQLVWVADAGGLFWTAYVPLTTAALLALFASNTTANVTLKIGYSQGGFPVISFNKPITMGVGTPGATPSVPAGQTAMTVEVANSLFLQQAGVNVIYLKAPSGKIMELRAVDTADGSVAPDWGNVT